MNFTERQEKWADKDPFEQRTRGERYFHLPPEAIGLGLGLAAGGALALSRCLKVVRPGDEGVLVTLGHRHSHSWKEGPHLRIPHLQQVVTVDMRPQTIEPQGVQIEALTGDGTKITGKPFAVLKVADPVGLVAKAAELKPRIELEEDAEAVRVVAAVMESLARPIFASISTPDLMNPQKLENLRETAKKELQKALDGIYLDEREREDLQAQIGEGMTRGKINLGVIVAEAFYTNITISSEVVEALQENSGAQYRLAAERMALQVLGRDYDVFRRATAAEQAAREGANTVVVLDGKRGEGAVLGAINQARGEIKELKDGS